MRRTTSLLRVFPKRINTSFNPKIVPFNFSRIAFNKSITPLSVTKRTYTVESDSHDDFKPKPKASVEERINAMQPKIEEDVKSDKIVLFMKGFPERPECGFSQAMVNLLKFHGYKYSAFNVNADALYKESVKKYANWPTFPQLWVNGEFIGGIDICVNLHREGELAKILKESGAEYIKDKK